MFGFILVNKPKGISSFRVVSVVRGIIRAITGQKLKVGHSGTLDPQASGLLLLAIGKATKEIPKQIKKDKTYLVTMYLGKTSTTGDSEGLIEYYSDKKPSIEDIEHVLNKFVGEINQTPPIYSAIKINGQRSYKLARKGEKPQLESRRVIIEHNKPLFYKYPLVVFESKVSSGTYIRSLVEDIGSKLETKAYMSDLVRTEIGNYKLGDALDFEKLNFDTIESKLFSIP
jgi:tRNA pseudouridine55 synthase